MKIKLSDADRALYGAPDGWLDWDAGRFLTSEAEAFQELVRDAAGNAIPLRDYQVWLRTAGVPATKWALWLALRRAGTVVDWAVFDPDLFGAGYQLPDAEPPAAEVPAGGKAPARSTRGRRSGSAASSTPQP